MKSHLLIILPVLLLFTNCAIPELQAGLSIDIVNRQLADTLGPMIIDQVLKYNITQNFTENTTIDGVKVDVTLSKLKFDTLEIKWTDDVLEPVSEYNFTFFGRNINTTVEAFVDGKISLKKIKTTAIVTITQMDMNVSMGILPLTTTGTGAGFNLKIFHIQLDIKNIDVKFLNDTIDTTIVQLIIRLIKSSLPNIINKAAQQKINPAIQQLLSNRVFLDQKVGSYVYSFDLNTTTLPMFYNKSYLSIPIDIIINNLDTKSSNPQIQNDHLPVKVFPAIHEAQLIISSGFIYSLIWLIEDSNVVNVVVDNSMLPPGQSPVDLTTTGLAILLPELPGKYGADKGVYIEVTTSTKIPELYIRQGRFIVSLSVNLNFVVDNTMDYPKNKNLTKCMVEAKCSNATTLNTSVLVSAAIKTDTKNSVFGNVQLVKIEDMQTYADSEINVNTKSLKMILNTLVGTFVAPINLLLRDGYPIPMAILKGFNITNVQIKTEQDYMATGLTFELSQ